MAEDDFFQFRAVRRFIFRRTEAHAAEEPDLQFPHPGQGTEQFVIGCPDIRFTARGFPAVGDGAAVAVDGDPGCMELFRHRFEFSLGQCCKIFAVDSPAFHEFPAEFPRCFELHRKIASGFICETC